MNFFKNILVVNDSSIQLEHNPAFKRAIKLAVENESQLTVLDVVSESDGLLKDYDGIIKAEELTEIIVENRRSLLNTVSSKLVNEVPNIRGIVVTGREFIEVIKQVLRAEHDLVIKTADTNLQSYNSNDLHLMRKCPCPVWLINPVHSTEENSILAAIDLSLEKTCEGRLMNQLIMNLATSLQSINKGKLHVLSCWSLYAENTLRDSPFLAVSKAQLDDLLEKEKSLNNKVMQDLCSEFKHIPITTHLNKGRPAILIPDFVHKNKIDTVVMGTVGRTGIPGFFIGNTAETVLRSIKSSTITVKPDGFQTPIN